MNFVVVFPTEYRVELYSRLENKRIKQLVRTNRKASGKETTRQPLKERKVYLGQTKFSAQPTKIIPIFSLLDRLN